MSDEEHDDLQSADSLAGLHADVSRTLGRLELGEADGGVEPQLLQAQETSTDELLACLTRMVADTGGSDDEREELPVAGRLARAACMAHAAGAYCELLPRERQARLHATISDATQRFITHMFRVSQWSVLCWHADPLDGLVCVARALLARFPHSEDGAQTWGSKPTVYASVASAPGVARYLCRQLGLPLSCVRAVPDARSLSTLLEGDIAAGHVPLLVLGEAGAGPLGRTDDLRTLREICRERGLHLHLRGHSLAALTLNAQPISDAPADSATLAPGTWFGVPGLPFITMYRSEGVPEEPRRTRSASPLPLWSVLRAAGYVALTKHLAAAFRAATIFRELLTEMPPFRILSRRPALEEAMACQADVWEVLESATPCVTFQFSGGGAQPARLPPYFDRLNSWLAQILQRETDLVYVDGVETEQYGLVLRYCPLETGGQAAEPGGAAQLPQHVDELRECISRQLDILAATLALRDKWSELVARHPQLHAVEVAGWAGLGGVRYVPSPPPAPRVLDAVNRALVTALRDTDTAFSVGEGVDGLACVRFGMVTGDTDVEELLSLCVQTGRELEERGRMLDTMTEIVKRGIVTATADLQREQEARLWQEGLLRRVPVFGRVVDWWSPAPQQAPPGRTLDLARGRLVSTEDIYKYHAQAPGGVAAPSPVSSATEAPGNTAQEPLNTVQEPHNTAEQSGNTDDGAEPRTPADATEATER